MLFQGFWFQDLILIFVTWSFLKLSGLRLLSRLANTQSITIQTSGTTTSLTIANITEEDYGNYTCVASNRLGVQNASLFLYSEYIHNKMVNRLVPIEYFSTLTEWSKWFIVQASFSQSHIYSCEHFFL